MKFAVEFVTVPRDGEKENGDAALVRRTDEGALISVIDALGHGARAAEAAAVAMRYLAEAPLERGLRAMVDGLHEKLRGTRGAAAMLLLIRHNRLEGCGVGNVGLRSYRARIPAMLTPGVLGGSITRLRLFQAELAPSARIILFSDGISARFEEDVGSSPGALATCVAIMERHRKPHDDATVLVTDVESDHSVGRDGGDPQTPGPAGRDGGGAAMPPLRAL